MRLHFRKPEYRHERNLWTTEIIPVLAIVVMVVVLWLLWANLSKIGGSIIWVDIIRGSASAGWPSASCWHW